MCSRQRELIENAGEEDFDRLECIGKRIHFRLGSLNLIRIRIRIRIRILILSPKRLIAPLHKKAAESRMKFKSENVQYN